MPAPSVATYSVDALVDAHTAFLALLDADTGPGLCRIRDNADVLLAEITLDNPAGTVNGGTGQLTITFDGRDESANASGTAAYGELTDASGNVHLSIPTQAGSTPVAGKLVLNTLTIVAGLPVEILTCTIG